MKWTFHAFKRLMRFICGAWDMLRETALEWDRDSVMQLAATLSERRPEPAPAAIEAARFVPGLTGS